MKKCKICGCMFDEQDEGVIVNEGMAGEFRICGTCLESECNAGRIISCDACGEYFTAGLLHDEEIYGDSFTACPKCGRDVVEGLTREQFTDERKPNRYAVVVQYFRDTRGYIVHAQSSGDVLKKLAEKVDLQCAVSVTYSQILLKEDEF